MGAIAAIVFFILIPSGTLAAVVLGIRTFAQGSARAGHWSPRTLVHPMADAPFRDPTLTESKARGAPIWLRLTAGLGAAFGVATVVCLAPAGLLFGIMMTSDTVVLGIFAVLVSASGFSAGTFLATSALRAVRGQRTAGGVTTYLYLHHLAVTLVMGSALLGIRDMYTPKAGLSVVLSCGLGLLITLAIQVAPRLPGASHSSDR